MLKLVIKKNKKKFSKTFSIFVNYKHKNIQKIGNIYWMDNTKYIFLNKSQLMYWLANGLKINKFILFYLEIFTFLDEN